MISENLQTKKDILEFKNRIRAAFENQGIRLGKSNQKLDAIIADLFGAKNYNAFVAEVLKAPESKFFITARENGFHSTESAKQAVLSAVRKITNIEGIYFGVRDGELNRHALTILVASEKVKKIFDTTLLTIERTQRESEVVDILRIIKGMGLLPKTRFYVERVPETSFLDSNEAIEKLEGIHSTPIFPNWREFLSVFDANYPDYQGIFLDEEWNELSA